MSFNSPFTGQVIQPTDVSFRSITLSSNVALEWPLNGNAVGDVAARIMEVTATSAGYELAMPPADQTSVGQDALIRNIGSNSFDVTDYDGNTIVTVQAGDAKYIYIETNATNAGTWGLIAFGVGTSSTDAATLAGYGLLASGLTLNQAHTVQTFSSSYTAQASDRASSYVWTGGSGTLTLPLASSLGNNWFLMIRNGGTGTLTVATTGGDVFNGSGSVILQPADSCFICCSGAAFYSVGLGRATQFNFTQLTKAVTSGTYTLTSSEAANTIQKYTGTLTGNVTVILPQTIQIYYITNQTDGGGSGFQITFTTNSPGGGTATVPASQQVILLCDSVNLLNASTIAAGAVNFSLVDGTAGAPSLNFATELSTGIFRGGTGEFNLAVLGTEAFALSNDGVGNIGLNIPGTGNFTGGVRGGLF